MRILHVFLFCLLLSAALLWLGRFGKLRRQTAAVGAAVLLLTGGVLLLLAVLPGNSFYGPVFTGAPPSGAVPPVRPRIALTFDDGPYPPYTQQLLAALSAKRVRATFFMVGENAARYPELVRRVQAEGHEIALHAGRHQDLLRLNRTELEANIAFGKSTLEGITGQPLRCMRPPHGFKDWQVMEAVSEAGLQAVNWSIIPRDWTNPGTEKIAARVCFDARPGGIVLLHDGDSPAQTAPRAQTVAAVPLIIDRLRSEGYEFVTVSELMTP